jgi:hypothetical protein
VASSLIDTETGDVWGYKIVDEQVVTRRIARRPPIAP